MSGERWSQIDRFLAQTVVSRGFLTRDQARALHREARARGKSLRGSLLAEAIARRRLVPAPTLGLMLDSFGAPSDARELGALAERRAQEEDGASTICTPTAPGSPPLPAAPGAARAWAAESDPEDLLFTGERYSCEETGPEALALDVRVQRKVLLRRTTPRGPAEERAFLREARVLAQLDHPAIPRVHDLGRTGAQLYCTVDACQGELLGDVAKVGDDHPASLPSKLRAFLSVCAAIAHAHDVGLLHCALGERSVRLASLGRVWVTDWSFARASRAASEGVRRATAGEPPSSPPAEQAPELAAGRRATTRTDVFGLGVVLHWLLAGAAPEPGEEPAPPGRAWGATPDDLVAIARKALAQDPSRRYQRVADLREDVRRALDGRRVSAAREGLWGAWRRWARHHPAQAFITTSAALAVAALGGLAGARLYDDARLAATAHERARQRSQEADASRALAELRQREASEDAQGALWELEFKAALARPWRRSTLVEAPFAAAQRLLRTPPPGVAPDASARDELLRARASWWLNYAPGLEGADRRALASGTRRAFEDANSVEAPEPDDLLVRFLAARRLPGAAFAEAEDRAIAALRGLPHEESKRLDEDLSQIAALTARAWGQARSERPPPGDSTTPSSRSPGAGSARPPEADASELTALRRKVRASLFYELGDLLQAVRQIEALAERDEPTSIERASDARLERRLKRLCESLPDVALGFELDGRRLFCETGLSQGQGRGRWKDPKLLDSLTAVAASGFQRTTMALTLDPFDPNPRSILTRQWNNKFRLHAPWRWISGQLHTTHLEAARLTLRPEHLVALAEELALLGRPDALLEELEALCDDPALRPRAGGRRAPDPWAHADLMRARARLHTGGLPPSGLAELPVAEALRTQLGVLEGWSLLIRGDRRAGGERLVQAIRATRGAPGRLVRFDLLAALTDPRLDPKVALRLLDRLIPPRGPAPAFLLQSRLRVRVRQGVADVEDSRRLLEIRRPSVGSAVAVDFWQATAAAAPTRPSSHLSALEAWTNVGLLFDSLEPRCEESRLLVVDHLRERGLEAAAAQFEDVDAVNELWVRRQWVPRALHYRRRPR